MIDQLCLGTWQFALKHLSRDEMRSVITYALRLGISWFDTAEVYGDGEQESVLGEFPEARVITKIPAMVKPDAYGLPLKKYYTEEYIRSMYELSLSRLKRPVDILLLHNWTDDWNSCDELFLWIQELKREGLCSEIGISLSNVYQGAPPPFPFDWIMAPLNLHSDWIKQNCSNLRPESKIMVRSLFDRGRQIPPEIEERRKYLKRASFADKIVIGMTRREVIEENVKLFLQLGEL